MRSLPLRFFLGIAAFTIAGCVDQRTTSDSPSNQQDATARTTMHPKLRELASLPTGIRVVHSPNPVKAQPRARSGYRYTWVYATAVSGNTDEMTIDEFGCFSWDGGQWVFSNYTRRPFTAQDFAEWYSCPNAVLVSRQEFSDPSNWSGNDSLVAGKMKWYFIGHDRQGKRFKGEAVVELRAEVEP